MNSLHQQYKAMPGGCVVDHRGAVVYERIPGVPSQAIADALNHFHSNGIDADWSMIEQRLIACGALKRPPIEDETLAVLDGWPLIITVEADRYKLSGASIDREQNQQRYARVVANAPTNELRGIEKAEAEVIARRLVACWNACHGIATEELESMAAAFAKYYAPPK